MLRRISAAKAVAEPESPSGELKRVQVDPKALMALQNLTSLLTATEFPTEPRELSEVEQKAYVELATESKLAIKALDDAVEEVKQAVFGHFDTKLLQDTPEADLPKDPEYGWFLVENEMEVPGTGMRLKRELAETQPQLTAANLKKLHEEGKITREDYYGMTVHQDARAFDADAFLSYLKKKPKVIEKLADIIVPGKITARFWVRPVKKGKTKA